MLPKVLAQRWDTLEKMSESIDKGEITIAPKIGRLGGRRFIVDVKVGTKTKHFSVKMNDMIKHTKQFSNLSLYSDPKEAHHLKIVVNHLRGLHKAGNDLLKNSSTFKQNMTAIRRAYGRGLYHRPNTFKRMDETADMILNLPENKPAKPAPKPDSTWVAAQPAQKKKTAAAKTAAKNTTHPAKPHKAKSDGSISHTAHPAKALKTKSHDGTMPPEKTLKEKSLGASDSKSEVKHRKLTM